MPVSFNQKARRPLAQLQPLYVIAFPSRERGSVQARVDMGANVSPAQLEVIERERDGGPIMLHLRLQGVVFRPNPHTDLTPRTIDLTPKTIGFWGELEYQVKPTQWIEVLQHLNYAQGFLLQVPKFESRSSAKAVEATTDLEKAITHMSEGRFKDVVAACRDALEVAYGVNDRGLHPELGYTAGNVRAADKATRFWLVRQALWDVTHAAKHKDEVTQPIEWERRDAVAVVTMLSAMLEQDPPL